MVYCKSKIFFKIIRYILEPWPDIDELKRHYSVIYILSYEKKDLAGFEIKVKDTPVIYFNRGLEVIFNNFNSTTRNEIRKTLDDKISGLKFVVNDDDIFSNYKLSVDFELSQSRRPDSIREYYGCKIFSAYYCDDLIANIICFDNGEVLRAKAICSKRLQIKDKNMYNIISYAGRRLMYEVCQYGIENNYKMYDLGSVNFDKANLAKFKMSFTSDVIKEYSYTYRSPVAQAIESSRLVLRKLIR